MTGNRSGVVLRGVEHLEGVMVTYGHGRHCMTM
jgi:hypothetical protein